MYAWHISFIEKAERFFIVLLIWIARCFNPLKYELFGDLSLFCICYNVPKYIWSRTVESSIYDFGSMLSSVWKDGHFLSCEKNIERCLKDKWQMASTSLMTKIPQNTYFSVGRAIASWKSHIPVGSNCWSSSGDHKCKQQWWLSRHHFHHLLFIVLHIWARVRVDLAEQ